MYSLLSLDKFSSWRQAVSTTKCFCNSIGECCHDKPYIGLLHSIYVINRARWLWITKFSRPIFRNMSATQSSRQPFSWLSQFPTSRVLAILLRLLQVACLSSWDCWCPIHRCRQFSSQMIILLLFNGAPVVLIASTSMSLNMQGRKVLPRQQVHRLAQALHRLTR